MKKCSQCKIEKEDNCFARNKSKSGGLSSQCKGCVSSYQKKKRLDNSIEAREQDRKAYQKSRDRRVQYAREYRKNYPDRTRATNLKYKYGLTQEDFEKMLVEQDGKCAICNRPQEGYSRTFSIDHNHTSGKIRGLLCDPCNYGLGFYEKHKDKYEQYLKVYELAE